MNTCAGVGGYEFGPDQALRERVEDEFCSRPQVQLRMMWRDPLTIREEDVDDGLERLEAARVASGGLH
jgi:hypothetical protein